MEKKPEFDAVFNICQSRPVGKVAESEFIESVANKIIRTESANCVKVSVKTRLHKVVVQKVN